LAVAAAAAVALEGIVATRAMVGLDTNTVMAVRELLSAVMFGLVLLAVPGGIAAAGSVIADTGLIVPIVCAGMIGGYSYAIWYRSIRKIGVARAMALNISYAVWGAVFAWSMLQVPPTLFAIIGCAVVTGGAVLTILSGRPESACVPSKSAGPVTVRLRACWRRVGVPAAPCRLQRASSTSPLACRRDGARDEVLPRPRSDRAGRSAQVTRK
jgi:uncharacterized membrane protein